MAGVDFRSAAFQNNWRNMKDENVTCWPRTVEQLRFDIKQEWEKIVISRLQQLVASS